MRRNVKLYDADFHAWTQEQARALRAREFTRLDIENVAAEIESMGRSDRREISNRFVVLIAHLLKWQLQPSERGAGWAGTIVEQRRQLRKLLAESPSLRAYAETENRAVYGEAREDAARESGLALDLFPAEMPDTLDELMDPRFLPGGA